MATKPFYGDPTNQAPVYNKFAVLLGSLTATKPTGTPSGGTIATRGFILNDPGAGTPITTEWDPVGALHEDTPLTGGAETLDVTNHTAAGFGVYAKTYRNQEETFEFTSLERTLTALGLIYDASGVTEAGGNLSGKLKQRDPTETFLIGFVRENANEMERFVSENYAQINTITRNQTNGRGEVTVSVTVFPNSDNELFDYYRGELS